MGKERFCGDAPDFLEYSGERASWDLPYDHHGIREIYGVEIARHFYARAHEEMIPILFDLQFMLEGLIDDLQEVPHLVLVDLAEAF